MALSILSIFIATGAKTGAIMEMAPLAWIPTETTVTTGDMTMKDQALFLLPMSIEAHLLFPNQRHRLSEISLPKEIFKQ